MLLILRRQEYAQVLAGARARQESLQSDNSILLVINRRRSCSAHILRVLESGMLVGHNVSLLGGHLIVAIDTGLSRADNAHAHTSLAADGLVIGRRLLMNVMIRSAVVKTFSSLALLLIDLEFDDGLRAEARLRRMSCAGAETMMTVVVLVVARLSSSVETRMNHALVERLNVF